MTDDQSAHTFAIEVCNGNQEAMVFVTLWYRYCHRIDDLLDTREDGRPIMSAEEILETFLLAAMLYSCPFYKKHSDMLLSTVITTTNAYADSVAWERSPIDHRRNIGNILRTCGNEMFFLVATITGGISHMRKVSQRIRETDFLRQKGDEF